MNLVAWGAIATLTVFLLANIGLLIHWSARISTLLEGVQNEIKNLAEQLKDFRGLYSTKEEAGFSKLLVDKEFTAVWHQIDALKAAR